MAQDKFLNKTGLEQFATEFHNRLESEIGNDNLLDAFNPVISNYTGYHDANTVIITNPAKDQASNDPTKAVDCTISLALSSPLLVGETYTLSFDCKNIPDNLDERILTYNLYQCRDTLGNDSCHFILHNGKCTISFIPKVTRTSYLTLDNVYDLYFETPVVSIELSNFIIEKGLYTSNYRVPLESMSQKLDNIVTNTDAWVEGTWKLAVINNEFYTASRTLQKTVTNVTDFSGSSGKNMSELFKVMLPFPSNGMSVHGSCDSGGMYISNTNPYYTSDTNNVVGVWFRLVDPRARESSYLVTLRLGVSGAITKPPTNCSIAEDKTKGARLVAVAQSYIDARDNGRKFYYGRNFLYQNRNLHPEGASTNASLTFTSSNPFISGKTTIYTPYVENSLTFYDANNNELSATNVSVTPPQLKHNPGEGSANGVVTATVSGTVAKLTYTYLYDGSEPDNRINNRYGQGMMECDTLAGMVLRGIPYDQSPYVNTDALFGYVYEDLYQTSYSETSSFNTNTVYNTGDYVRVGYSGTAVVLPHTYPNGQKPINPAPGVVRYWYYKSKIDNNQGNNPVNNPDKWEEVWVANPNGLSIITSLNTVITNSELCEYLGHTHVRFASDDAYMGWRLNSGALFTSVSDARPGDLIFWKNLSGTNHYFDGITHVGVVGYDANSTSTETLPDIPNTPIPVTSANPDFWIYEMTGMDNSHRYCLNKRRLSEFGNRTPCYFVRPYGFTFS